MITISILLVTPTIEHHSFKPGKFKHHRLFKLSFLYHAKFLIQNRETTQSYTTLIRFKRFSAGKIDVLEL